MNITITTQSLITAATALSAVLALGGATGFDDAQYFVEV